MNKVFLASILSTNMILPASWTVNSLPPDTLRKVEKSIVRINHPVQAVNFFTGEVITFYATCTGFVIKNDRNFVEGDVVEFSYILTANHCMPDAPAVDEQPAPIIVDVYWPAEVVKVDVVNDLALIKANLTKPYLKSRQGSVTRGMPVFSFGYGYGLDTHLFLSHIVAAPLAVIDEGLPAGMLLSPGFVPGMSGGPVVDDMGRIVSIVQAGTSHGIGYGASLNVIKLFVGDYWGR